MNAVLHLPSSQELPGGHNPLGIALIGIDAGLEKTLRFFITTRCRDHFYLEPEGTQADLRIIDLDTRKGKKHWEQNSTKYPDRSAILLSLTETKIAGAELITKPVRVTALQSALDRGREQLQQLLRLEQVQRLLLQHNAGKPGALPNTLPRPIEGGEPTTRIERRKQSEPALEQVRPSRPKSGKNSAPHKAGVLLGEKDVHAFVGTAPEINPWDPQQLQKAQYDPENFLAGRVLHAFQSAEQRKRPVCLKSDRGSLTLFPGDRKILVWMRERHLRALAALPLDEGSLSVSELEIGPSSDLDQQDLQYDLDAFVWKQTLRACRGRMPLGTDPMAPVVLTRWPNLTRLQVTPHALRIAALWIQARHSLIDTAKVLNIPQRDVFAFYSATHALGLAATAPGIKTAPIPAESQPALGPGAVRKHQKRGLLSRILKRLSVN